MKENELRIGNWVTNSLGDIYQIETGAFYLYHLNKEWDVKPIKLTEEWLIKFGISKWFLERFQIRKNENETYSVYAWKSGTAVFIRDLKYVHQLQNLYFVLRGAEL